MVMTANTINVRTSFIMERFKKCVTTGEPAREILKFPEHPYTRMLIDSMPSISHRKPLKVVAESAKQEFAQYLKTPLQFDEVSPDHWVAGYT